MDGSMKIAFSESEGGCGSCSGGHQSGGARKLNPYARFVKQNFSSMKKAHPSMTAPSIMKALAKKWKAAHPDAAKKSASKKSSTRKSSTRKSSTRKSSKK